MQHRPQGILVAALTPRRRDTCAIHFDAALELISFLESAGVDGFTLLGSTGEFPNFSIEDRAKLARVVTANTRLPVLVNVSHSTLDGAAGLGRDAADAGAAGVLVTPPYYYKYSQDSIRAFCLELASRVPAPVYLYNIPQFTNPLELTTSLDLLSTGAFAGIKDSLARWDDFESLQSLADARGFAVYTGGEAIYSRACKRGAAGIISGVANAMPELMVAIDRAARAGRDTSELDAQLLEFLRRLEGFPMPAPIREAAASRGLEVGPHALPFGTGERKRMDEFRAWFEQTGVKRQETGDRSQESESSMNS
jgi:dihydrodipicolinate synthase/N-acetylneuraminate lyase